MYENFTNSKFHLLSEKKTAKTFSKFQSRNFELPIIEKIEVIRKGNVNRAKLYYLRNRTGKKARIADKDRGDEANQFDFIEETLNEESSEKEKIDEGQEKKVEAQLSKEEEIVEEKIEKPESSTKEAEEKSDEQKS